jgi:hypothetical protein
MKKLTIILAGLTLALSFNSCKKKGCTNELASNYSSEAEKDDGSCVIEPVVPESATLSLNFTQNFNGSNVTVSEFNTIAYTNANGEELSLTKLQYSISDVRFYLPNGDSVYVDDSYNLIDLEESTSLTYDLTSLMELVSSTEYTGVGFNYGFDATDNTSGAYTDLNAASWGWPDMIGGGYHQMKMEGKYLDATGTEVSYAFHNGSATKNAAGDFESNYRFIKLDNSGFTLEGNTVVEVKMNIANWYTNPNTWDLNVLYTMLMPNYDAQIMMTQNAIDVFSVGAITH